ncbi:MAG: glycoside hydrolase family 3 C-terminal domain-containing protein [Bacteroidaceae bacterium]
MKRLSLSILSLFLILVSFSVTAQTSAGTKKTVPTYLDESIDFEVRAQAIVKLMTLKEKVEQMREYAPAIPRLGIPTYFWWNETLHGVARSKDTVTVFPQAIAMAACFDRQAMKVMGDICATEARAIYNQSFLDGDRGAQYKGLTFWTPNINIFRDPRWGRGQETYGEDPYLTGQLGVAIVKGLEGDNPRYLKTSACAKHFAVHSGPESTRHTFDVDVSDADLWNTYLPAFRDLVVDGKVSSVMCAYNRFRGKPCCANQHLMVDVLRNMWGFKGYVTSDCGAVTDFWHTHKTYKDAEHSAVAAVNATTDLECGSFWSKNWTFNSLTKAVKDSLIDEKELDIAVGRLMLTRMRLGMFDKKENVPYSAIPYSILNAPEHAAHALKMAHESMVLLKNNGLLPLNKNLKNIAVVGPNADAEATLLGNYNGIPKQIVTVLDGITEKLGDSSKVIYAQGVNFVELLEGESLQDAVAKVQDADVVVFVGGINSKYEGEQGDTGNIPGFFEGDRTSIMLPKVQTDMMKALSAAGKKVIFVNMSGSAMGMPWEVENADAILQAWYGGQSAGTAIADILFGDYNPSGKLPVTFYKNDQDLPDFSDYKMENRTYRYFKGEPQYAFGYGLSYTTYKCSNLQIVKTHGMNVRVEVTVENTGKKSGDEVVELYISAADKDMNPAIRSLKGFQRVHLAVGEKKILSFDLNTMDWAAIADDGQAQKPRGTYSISIGGSQPNDAIFNGVTETYDFE